MSIFNTRHPHLCGLRYTRLHSPFTSQRDLLKVHVGLRHVSRLRQSRHAFTLVELMAVVAIILILLGGASVVFMNGRESIQVRNDANHLISFMRSMLDYTKATGVPLVIEFDTKKKSFSYLDPRLSEKRTAELESSAKVLAIKLNERLLTPERLATANAEDESSYDDESTESVYISEGRGLITMSMLLAVYNEEKEEVETAFLSELNLISGRGRVLKLKTEEVQAFFQESEEPVEVDQ
ncbi:MAG: hypothetical protein CR997_08085 [Acidobacteria bacterium]|nr:MAG: hypothetical protein CR997_08085 [Acidobacteriota bacterium]